MSQSGSSKSNVAHVDDDSTEIPDDPRLLEIARDYLARLEAGERPNLEEYVARLPELEVAVRSCLEGLNLVHQTVRTDRVAFAASGHAASEVPLEPLGDFRILRELGRGGMGIVYEAVQMSLGRHVAIKILPFTATLQPRQLQRFLNEAQAAAHLHHPNIVPVFAVGCDRGVHYYAMQMIDGMSLAELLHSLRHDAGWKHVSRAGSSWISIPEETGVSAADADEKPHCPPTMKLYSSQLSTECSARRSDYFRSIARFGQQAAEALNYAHELGIVHRDIKPGNLMVDARGKVWITDFGLAQVQREADLTQTGDLLGTVRYMSPEQVQGDRTLLDQRTDIYSLGATLYELATLEPMFSGGNRELMLHRVLNEEPVAPRTINRAIPVELETIIVKAISKSPADRYISAERLAEDLNRFLSDQPILAKRPTWTDRVRKWSRRHPGMVASMVVILLLLSIGLLIHNRSISQEQLRTQDALQRERVRTAEAEQSFQQARRAVDMLIQISEEELGDKPPLQPTRKRLLLAALQYYQQFIAQRSGDKASTEDLAAVETRVKGILQELSIVDGLFRLMPVTFPDVQADLKVSPEQQLQLAELQKQFDVERKEMAALAGASSEERHRRFVSFADSQARRVAEVLTEGQRKRLNQISLQCQRVFAFLDPDVIQTLKLTAGQQREIREIEFQSFMSRGGPKPFDQPPPGEFRGPPPDNFCDGPPDGFHGPPRGDFRGPPPSREDDDRRLREATQKVVALLTPEQAARWQEMTGAEFTGKTGMFQGGHFGGGPRIDHRHDGPRRD